MNLFFIQQYIVAMTSQLLTAIQSSDYSQLVSRHRLLSEK